MDSLEVGSKHKGTVRSIVAFGAFVDIGAERDGLVHISQITDQRVNNVRDYLEEGEEIEVWVSKIENNRLGLTMLEGGSGGGARADVSPFTSVSPDEWLTGTVATVTNFGAFVKVVGPDGAEASGLVHISQLSDGFVEDPRDHVTEGQEVKVRVTQVDPGENRMSLSMKDGSGDGEAPREPVDLSPFADVASSEWLTGIVKRTAPFGAFVTVTAPGTDVTTDGLVHITRISDGYVADVEDEVQVGQEVQVRIESVDIDEGKLGLTMVAADGGDSEDY